MGVSQAVSIRFGFKVAGFVTTRLLYVHIVIIGFVLVTAALPSCTKLEAADESAYDRRNKVVA